MKIQCSCGAKHSFEITSEMRTSPVRFVCPACGLDASEFVDGLIRQELGQAASPPGRVVTIQVAADPSAAQGSGPLRVQLAREPVPEPATAVETDALPRCLKHPGQVAHEKCVVCSKPICPKCMELFGYVCSPLCKARADSHGIEVPVFKGQKALVEARLWRKLGWAAWGLATLAVLLIGFWIWYAWFGVVPKVFFSIRFPETAYSGQSAFGGNDQIVFLHGGLLARYDMKQKKEIWSRSLLDKAEIQAEIGRETERAKALIAKANMEAWEHMPKMPDPERLARDLEREMAASLELRVQGKNIWVISPKKLTRYEWETGQPAQEVALDAGAGSLIGRGDELLLMKEQAGKACVMRVNLTTCDSRTVDLGGPELILDRRPAVAQAKPAARPPGTAGLPTGMPGREAGQVMDPAKVAQQAQHLTLAGRIALPAVLANSWNQERALAELNDNPSPKAQPTATVPQFEQVTIIPARDRFVEFSWRMLERKTGTRAVMKPPPAKSVLEGPVNVTQSAEVANEILNEMQRSRGGDVVEEDLSRYQVKLRDAGKPEGWIGEVVGPPMVFPLETVNVLVANKTVLVFDNANHKLWQTTLTYPLNSSGGLTTTPTGYGQGPCVERNGMLYIFDQAVLNALELKTGNARWHLPSVGITGLFFDEQGMLYVNTTTAGPESVKFSRQIDINQRAVSVVLKVDPANGKILWSAQPGGLVNYVSGKYIYLVQSYAPEEQEDNPYQPETGFERLPYVRIKRINPKNGHEMWEHFQQRAPLDLEFQQNRIRLVFKKEVQVLKPTAG